MKAHLYSVWPIATPVIPAGNSVWGNLRPQVKGEEPLQHHYSVRYCHPLHYCIHTHIDTRTIIPFQSYFKFVHVSVCLCVCLLLYSWILWWFSVLCLTELTKLTTYLLQLLLKRQTQKHKKHIGYRTDLQDRCVISPWGTAPDSQGEGRACCSHVLCPPAGSAAQCLPAESDSAPAAHEKTLPATHTQCPEPEHNTSSETDFKWFYAVCIVKEQYLSNLIF